MVVGRVHGGFVGFLGAQRSFWGGSGGVQRGLLFSQKANFAPLEVLYGTRFGSKYYIIVKLALLAHFWLIRALLGTPKRSNP